MEGFSTQHDLRHSVADLLQMAGCYLGLAAELSEGSRRETDIGLQQVPPKWQEEQFGPWKPANAPERNLEKGGALVIAAFDRLAATP